MISLKILEVTGWCILPGRMTQFIIIAVLQHVFGMVPAQILSMLESPFFSRVRSWIAQQHCKFPGENTYISRYGSICEHGLADIEKLATQIQDAFQLEIGKVARANFASIIISRREHVVPNEECFIGVVAPSVILPGKSVFERGVLLPYLNARIYMKARKTTSVTEFIGELKKPVMEQDTYYFPFAGTLGFHLQPPGKNEIHARFHQIDKYLSEFNEPITTELAKAGILDMSVVSIDTTNIPVDEKDKTGSIGTGSRGTFFGHKLAVALDSRCMPIEGTLHEGRQADVTTFDGVFDPVKDMLSKTGQDMWASVEDAGFSSSDVVDAIEGANAIAFVNVNAKNSERLKRLVTAAEALKDVSKKALDALPEAERRAWQDELKAISNANGKPVPLDEKKLFLSRVLQKFAARARRRGLTTEEKKEEDRLRKEVMAARRDIRAHGTAFEQKLGLTTIPLGTIEWQLVYAIRGQNEGINGIIKKRDDIIGDGQHSSWLHGHQAIESRCKATFTDIKIVALVAKESAGMESHYMSRVYNW